MIILRLLQFNTVFAFSFRTILAFSTYVVLGLGGKHFRISAVLPHQFIVASALDNSAALEHIYPIGVACSRESVRDENDGLILRERRYLLIQRIFSHRVERRRRLIHNYQVVIAREHARYRYLLLLTAREVCSLFSSNSRVSIVFMPPSSSASLSSNVALCSASRTVPSFESSYRSPSTFSATVAANIR